MSTLVLDPSTKASVAALAQVLWNAFATATIQTGSDGAPWPFSTQTLDPDRVDFAAQGPPMITVDGASGIVTLAFPKATSPIIGGSLDLTLLEAQLTTSPNLLDYDNPSPLGPAPSVSLTSPAFTRQKSGKVFLTAEFDGTQSAQAVVAAALYRDFGTPGQVALNAWHVAPGGLTPFNWSGHIHDTDTLPDDLPHTYTLVATSAGGSNLSVDTGAASLIVFELGGPG